MLREIKTQEWGTPIGIEMRNKISKIPDEVIKEIFPKKLSRYQSSDRVYTQLKKMILSGKLKKGERLSYEKIVHEFNVSREVAHRVISQLKKDGLLISKRGVGSFIT